MKLTYSERNELRNLIKAQISIIQNELIENNLDEHTIKSEIDKGNYELETIIEKKNMYKEILGKLKNVSLPGASNKQCSSLFETAKRKMLLTKEKIDNALRLLNLLNEKITISSVAKSAKISYNTAKKYKTLIINKEKLRLNTQFPLLQNN